MQLTKPKMVIFDAGRTLMNYKEINIRKGIEAYFPYIISNPHNYSIEEIEKQDDEIFGIFDLCRENRFEIPVKNKLRLLFDLLEIQLSIGAGCNIAGKEDGEGRETDHQNLLARKAVNHISAERTNDEGGNRIAAQHNSNHIFRGSKIFAQIEWEQGCEQIEGEIQQKVGSHENADRKTLKGVIPDVNSKAYKIS